MKMGLVSSQRTSKETEESVPRSQDTQDAKREDDKKRLTPIEYVRNGFLTDSSFVNDPTLLCQEEQARLFSPAPIPCVDAKEAQPCTMHTPHQRMGKS